MANEPRLVTVVLWHPCGPVPTHLCQYVNKLSTDCFAILDNSRKKFDSTGNINHLNDFSLGLRFRRGLVSSSGRLKAINFFKSKQLKGN